MSYFAVKSEFFLNFVVTSHQGVSENGRFEDPNVT